MTTETQAHHGIALSDVAAMTAAIAEIGFTEVEGGATEPRRYRNVAGDAVGQMVAPILGDEIRTWFVGNPATGQQLDLVELTAEATLVAAPGEAPAQGDLTIGIPAADPEATYATLRAAAPKLPCSDPAPCPSEDGVAFTLDAQRYILSRKPEPFAYVHYSTRDFPTARRFYEEVLGYRLVALAAHEPAEERFAIEGCGGRIEAVVRADTPVAAEGTGKRYIGSNHFRLLNADLAAVAERVESSGLGRWFFAPTEAGFSQIMGPTTEFIELYDRSVS